MKIIQHIRFAYLFYILIVHRHTITIWIRIMLILSYFIFMTIFCTIIVFNGDFNFENVCWSIFLAILVLIMLLIPITLLDLF